MPNYLLLLYFNIHVPSDGEIWNFWLKAFNWLDLTKRKLWTCGITYASSMQFNNTFRSLLSHAELSINGSVKANCLSQDTTSMINVAHKDETKPVLAFEIALCDHADSCPNIGLIEGIIEYIAV